jgi:hypothetical protein
VGLHRRNAVLVPILCQEVANPFPFVAMHLRQLVGTRNIRRGVFDFGCESRQKRIEFDFPGTTLRQRIRLDRLRRLLSSTYGCRTSEPELLRYGLFYIRVLAYRTPDGL